MDESIRQLFQFRLKDLFATIGATAIALTLLRLSIWLAYLEPFASPGLRNLAEFATTVAFGVAAGTLFKRPLLIAAIAGALYIAFALLPGPPMPR